MPTVQFLKKKLRGIRSTQKLSKAMKTAATVKYSRLSAAFSEYTLYERQCSSLFENYGAELVDSLPPAQGDAKVCFVVIGSNNGMCGSFNSDLCAFAEREIIKQGECVVYVCGRQTEAYFSEKKIPFAESFVFSDVPSHSQASALFDKLYRGLASGSFLAVKIIFQKYENMMTQTPVCVDLFVPAEKAGESDMLFIPDKQTVIGSTAGAVISSLVFSRVLETALGAQAATLMTMRSAYDTATELVGELEAEINRKRQSQVTADVLETSAEHTAETEV